MREPVLARTAPVLPLPSFVLRPFAAVIVAVVHVYLALSHLVPLFGGEWQWAHVWKGFGAVAGAYVFAALASRGLARRVQQIEIGARIG